MTGEGPRHDHPHPPAFGRARVGDVMHAGVVACPPETPLRTVARMMATHRIHAVVVLGSPKTYFDERLWRIVSDLDLVRASGSGLAVRTAGDTATTPVVTVAPDDSLGHAARLMGEHGTAHVVVVDAASDQPVGVLSTLDVAGVIAWGKEEHAGGS